MPLHLYNTLSGRTEALEPCEPGHVRLYVCGQTVYDHAHVGHMRTQLTYDFLVRHLREGGLRVTYVRNITDVDDKIIRRSAEAGESPMVLAQRYALANHKSALQLGLIDPDVEPCVSTHIDPIRTLIATLVEKGAAYAAGGDVYFSVQAFPAYGKLSHRKQSDLEYGASGRLDDDELRRKRHPADFALWKGAKPGEISWESPWGPGRPGWHIECSAMCMCHLGESIDIHGGALDLVFPHHENEIAQSEAATGKPFSRIWMHCGFLETSKEKMSKSLGNFLTASDCFQLFEPEALRYLAMTVHYRSPLGLDWSVDERGQINGCVQLEEAERRVEYVYRTRARLGAIARERLVESGEIAEEIVALGKHLDAALDDDINMPVVLAVVAEFLKQVNDVAERTKAKKGGVSRAAVAAAEDGFARLARVVGLGGDDAGAWLARVRRRRALRLGLREEDIDQKLLERKQARMDRDFARADAVRDEIAALGVELMDSPEGTSWRIP